MLGLILDPKFNKIFFLKMEYVGDSCTLDFVIETTRRGRLKQAKKP